MRAPPFLVGTLVVMFSAIFIFLGARGLFRDIQFHYAGAKSMATIEDLSRTSSGTRRGGSSFKAKYTFPTTTSGEETVEVPISSASYYDLHTGQQVAVLYLPGVPGESRLDDQMDVDWQWHNHEGALAIGLFIATIGCFALFTASMSRRELR